MASMFDTIMDLPLFKGIGEAQLSLLLEKTSMEFLKFKQSDTIAEASSQVKALDFILSGDVRQIYKLKNYEISIEERLGKGGMIGALHLYGMDTTYTATCIAESKVSILRIDKTQYMNILQSDRIYILNFVNYLSALAQKSPDMILTTKLSGIDKSIYNLALTFVNRNAETVKLASTDKELARYCGVTELEFKKWKEAQIASERINIEEKTLVIKPQKFNI